VQIHLKTGKHFEKRVRYPKGDPENPLTWQELSAKFHSLASLVLSKTRCDQIIAAVREMKSPADLRKIWKLSASPDALSAPAN
jgi:2-methylcitrate dehydratase PrpD